MSDNLNEDGKLIKTHDLVGLYSLSRSLDGIFWGLLAFYVCLIATIQDVIFSTFPFLCCMPLLIIAYSSFKIPGSFMDDSGWKKNIGSLKIYSLISALTFPFIVFLIRGGVSNHFVISSILAVYGILRLLVSMSNISIFLGKFYGEESLSKEGRTAVYCIYTSVTVAMAYMFFVTAQPVMANNLLNSGMLGLIIKISMLIIIVFPLLLPLTLLFRLKSLVIFNTKEKLRKY